MQDDVALNRKLIELAVNDVTLRFADGSRSFSPEELSAILETLVNLQRYTESMQAQGGSLEDLLSHREANGEFPEFLVKVRCGNEEEILFFHDMEALTAFSEETGTFSSSARPRKRSCWKILFRNGRGPAAAPSLMNCMKPKPSRGPWPGWRNWAFRGI